MFGKLLVPVDGSECSLKAAQTAGEIARRFGSRVTLAHAVYVPAGVVAAGSAGAMVAYESVMEAMEETVKVNNFTDCYIRAVVTRGMGSLGLDPAKCPGPSIIIIADTITLYPKEMYEKGMAVITATLAEGVQYSSLVFEDRVEYSPGGVVLVDTAQLAGDFSLQMLCWDKGGTYLGAIDLLRSATKAGTVEMPLLARMANLPAVPRFTPAPVFFCQPVLMTKPWGDDRGTPAAVGH